MSYGSQAPAYEGARQYYQAQQVSHLIGRHVRVNRGGPDSVEGVLVASPSDYLVVLADDTIVYVNALHVKSITEGGSASRGRSGGGKSDGRSSRSGMRSRSRSFITASNFHSVLTRLRHHHVQVNRGGPEKLDGFLAEIAADNVLLIVDRELVRIPTFHIKNVSISTAGSKSSSNGNKNQSGGNKNKSSGNKNKSSGGKSNKRSGKGKGKG